MTLINAVGHTVMTIKECQELRIKKYGLNGELYYLSEDYKKFCEWLENIKEVIE